MHSEVVQFAKYLREVDRGGAQLKMIVLRTKSLKDIYSWASEEKKKDIREQLQQFSDLFSHLYWKKPLQEFGNVKPIDNIR